MITNNHLLHFSAFLLLFVLLGSCKTKQIAGPAQYQGPKLHFGQGGGVIGKPDVFVLLDNGQLFYKAPMDTSFTHLPPFIADHTKQIFNNYDQLGLSNLENQNPGNLYHYFEYHHEGEATRFSWDPYDEKVDNRIKDFYKLISGLASRSKSEMKK